MRLHTASLLVLGVGLCGLAGAGATRAAEPERLPAFASRHFYDILQKLDPRPSTASEVADASAVRPTQVAAATAEPDAAPATSPAPAPATQPKAMPHLPAPTPPREAPASWPKTLPEAKAEAAAKMDLATYWPQSEVELAKARCTAILKSLDAVTIPEPPVRQGACGAPAPVRLVSIGKKPQVALTPPPLVTCDMVEALHAWITKDVQPLAKRTLGTQIVSMELMSDYSCRNAYGSRNGRLSEHARANALDIRGFLTAKGEMTAFLEDWGPTGREIREVAAREKAEAAKLAASKPAAAAQPQQTADAKGPAQPAETLSAAGLTRATIAEGLARIPSVPMTPHGAPAMGFAASHLGGPKPADARVPKRAGSQPAATASASPAPVTVEGRAAFLRQAHDTACKTFGTVLGPEANRAHRNHLHIDLADRSTGAFCE
jgi:hypothetical protein